MFTRTFDRFVTDTFQTAREDLAEGLRKIEAEQSLTSLESGQTVKRMGKKLIEIGQGAVDACRAEVGSSKRRKARLDAVLEREVDGLVKIVSDRTTALNLVDTAVFDRMAQSKDHILRDRSKPKPPTTSIGSRTWSAVKPHFAPSIAQIIVGVIVGLAVAVLIVVFGIPAARDQETKKAPDVAVESLQISGTH